MDFSNRPANRTWLCSVVFMDIISYTKHPLTQQIAMKNRFNEHVTTIANKHFSETDLIVVDSGDGGALCYLGDPEDMLFCARDLMEAFEACGDIDLPVRIGINLGPVKIHTSVAGQPNPIGDGINVAQRVMGFAEAGQIMISRSFYEVVGCLSEENSYMFEHVGIRSDKHIRKHDLYRIRTSQEVADVISSNDGNAHDYYTVNEDATESTSENINEHDLSTPACSVISAKYNMETNQSIAPPLQIDPSSIQAVQERQQLKKKIETALIRHIGPIAKILVRTEFKANRPAEQMIHNLSSHISEEAERTRFQTVIQGLIKNSQQSGGAEANSGNSSKAIDTTTNDENSKNWDQSELNTATNHLVPYMGPVAKILVKKTARHSADIETLYHELAKRIGNKSERREFLKQIGMQEKKP